MPTADRRAARSTYRSLRLGVVILLGLLGAAVVLESVRLGCWLDSLSAYYWSGARDALVGSLCAVGALLVAYTGTDDVEDALLDVAGLLALVVAFVPTEPRTGCAGPGAPSALAVEHDVRTQVAALVLAGLVAGTARAVVAARSGLPLPSTLVRAAVAVPAVVLAVAFAAAPQVVVARAHDVAAVVLFVAVIGVVVRRAFDARPTSGRWAAAYATVGSAMLLTLSVVVALHALAPAWGHAVLILEAALVAQFAVSWVLQTVELWGTDVVDGTTGPA
ncbi:hypothetical protein [Cellulomonas dongxiuzhuiae]|uniref:hypothetical protein n=1 Tax=Cellulomonas dongxiuzhuiae TaxID=2819979 RepID=UPI001AAEBF5D|nr:hypothetical protein [Cellulomonas dongxiuzhuiae]MBO3087053.1 hypothetical protein [Cellulomonas dongxiuzhuiae]